MDGKVATRIMANKSYRPSAYRGVKPEKKSGQQLRLRNILFLVLSVLFLLAVITHDGRDFAVVDGGMRTVVWQNWIGEIGARCAGSAFIYFGLAVYPLALLLLIFALRPFLPMADQRHRGRWIGLLLVLIGSSWLFGMFPKNFANITEVLNIGHQGVPESALSGGVIAQVLVAPPVLESAMQPGLPGGVLRNYLGEVGMLIIALAALVGGLVMIYLADWRGFFGRCHQAGERLEEGFSVFSQYFSKRPSGDDADGAGEECKDERKLANAVSEPEESQEVPAAASRKTTVETIAPAAEPTVVKETVKAADHEYEDLPAGSFLQAALRGEVPVAVEVAPYESEKPVEPELEPEPEPIIKPQETAVVASVNHDVEIEKDDYIAPPVARTVSPTADRASAAKDLLEEKRPEEIASNGSSMRPDNSLADYVLPPVAMLNKGNDFCGESPENIARTKEDLQRVLDDFRVDAKVTGHVTGPQVTRYEITMTPGIPVSKVANMDKDIAAQLSARTVRILAPIPGRNVVGVEVPNTRREAVALRTVLESDAWRKSNAEMPLVLGKNVSGQPVVMDLAKAPHMLIAGTTGSGKSVCLNSMIMSMFFKFRPNELSLILVDPKIVEFKPYEVLPHLITPVINEPGKALLALRWAVNEMDRRYQLLADARTRSLKEFNNRDLTKAPEFDANGEPIPAKLPLLVAIVDEFADLMMNDRNVRKDVETAIARIAQKGRAAGVHIILTTQRPSTNVVTGVIKANLPTKVALRVGTSIDSRVIIDRVGAESLLGWGDMLFLPPSSPELERIQGTMVSDEEIAKVIDFISSQAKPCFNERVVADPEVEEVDAPVASSGRSGGGKFGSGRSGGTPGEDDFAEAFSHHPLVDQYTQQGDSDLFKQALDIVFSEKQASTSYLQRRLKIGYNRAADLIDEMERRGIIGAARDGGSKREIMVFEDIG